MGENNTDLKKVQCLLSLMKDLKGREREVTNYLALALAKNGKVIWSNEEITDKGFIAKDLIDNNIPKYRWIGHVWYYPKHKKVFNQLDNNELEDIRKEGKELQESLVKQLEKII